ncbi:MAG: VWA domain-containing protein [Deltaproteobacteria bacterium]|nr:VWA domain-containing protein [Deltaproteobacteria bacterium]
MNLCKLATLTLLATLAGGCQAYDWVFQPDADREGAHLKFIVDQPSKADILFVIDNSKSMRNKQDGLVESVDVLLAALAPQDTRYRIGITSTDAIGYTEDCQRNPISSQYSPGAKGNCGFPAVLLNRPHDGALGRLIAAYDPDIFKLDASWLVTALDKITASGVTLDPDINTKLALLMPTGLTTTPGLDDPLFTAFTGERGARHVIDRETIRLEACQACAAMTTDDRGRPICDQSSSAFAACADPAAQIMVQAYFRANVHGLGINGMGWEEGLRAGMLAVGVDPRDEGVDAQGNPTALNPANDLTRVTDDPATTGANTFKALDEDTATAKPSSWLRQEALLAVMFVTDEEDCSMPEELWDRHCVYEEGCGGTWVPPPDWLQQPEGSMCYQEEVQRSFLSPTRMAQYLVAKKGGSASRVAIGVIAGVKKNGQGLLVDRSAQPVDCAPTDLGPTQACSCLVGADPAAPTCDLWCLFTDQKDGSCTSPDNVFCEGMASRRYVSFANSFSRRTYETVCLAESGDLCPTYADETTCKTHDECGWSFISAAAGFGCVAAGFGNAMAKFAQIATLACFELANVVPAGGDVSLITVKRASKADVENGKAPTLLQPQPAGSSDDGWYYDPVENKVCLTGLDRLIGDYYDIFLLHKDKLDFNH